MLCIVSGSWNRLGLRNDVMLSSIVGKVNLEVVVPLHSPEIGSIASSTHVVFNAPISEGEANAISNP